MREFLTAEGRTEGRRAVFDNLRAFALILVVFGHFLETFSSPLQRYFYSLIYLFHIPLLVFISGYFSKFNIRKIIKKLLFPFLIFQILYLAFDFFLYRKNFFSYYLFTPYWLLWYLISLITWRLSVFLLEKIKKKPLQSLIILVAVLIGLGSCFLPFHTRKFAIGRTLFFFPFFIAGYYSRNFNWEKAWGNVKIRNFFIVLGISLSFFIIIGLAFFKNIPNRLLYGADGNEKTLNVFFLRGYIYLIASILLATNFLIIPRKRIPFFENISKYSLQIYLLHGFLVVLLKRFSVIPNENISCLLLFLFSVFFVVFISSIFAKKTEKGGKKTKPLKGVLTCFR